ncbi:MAG: biotin/lipoyl-binding protein, partial [Deltaproteobacteria bacterium]
MTTSFAEAARGTLLAVFLSHILISTGCSKKPEPPKGRPPALVVTAVASQKNVAVQLNAIGTMEASESVTVRTQISGELTRVAFREGQDIQKGDVLFQLDPRTYQA